MVDGEPICDRCDHVWSAHSDRAWVPCVAAVHCPCSGWSRTLKPEGW